MGDDLTPETLAQRFHEAYERLAPEFGYRTREASAKPWEQVPEQNRALMTAVCAELLPQVVAAGRRQAADALQRAADSTRETYVRDAFKLAARIAAGAPAEPVEEDTVRG